MKIQDKEPHKVVSLVPTSPAAQSRIRVGHMLTAVNSQPVASMSADEIGALIRGFEGTPGICYLLCAPGICCTRAGAEWESCCSLWKEEGGRGGERFIVGWCV